VLRAARHRGGIIRLRACAYVPAWRSHPSWFLVAENDQAIPPGAERQFAKRMGAITVEVPAGHVAMVSHPDDVAQLIKTAAEAVQTAH
jgi:pimeloyl-ACP methyl ester carboxylesterase